MQNQTPHLAKTITLFSSQSRRLGGSGKTFGFREILNKIGPWLVVCLPNIFYQLLYVNSYFTVIEGWFSEYAHLIRAGLVPYKDFTLLLPPLYPLQIAGLQALFGENLIALHYAGIAVTCGIALALFAILKDVANMWVAAIAASFAIFHYQCGNAFFDYDFTQFLTLNLLIAGACCARFVAQRYAEDAVWRPRLLCLGAGFFLGCAFMTKQSNGGVTTLFLGLTMLIIAMRRYTWPKALHYIFIMAAGFLVPLAAIGLWLVSTGAFQDFWNSIAVDALAAKGGVDSTTIKWVREFFGRSFFYAAFKIGLQLIKIGFAMMLIAFATQWIITKFRKQPVFPARNLLAACLAVVATLCLMGVVTFIYYRHCTVCDPFGWGAAIYAGSFVWSTGLYILGFIAAAIAFYYYPLGKAATYLLLFGFGLGLTFGNGTSAGLCEISTFFGVSLLWVALLSEGSTRFLPALLPLGMMLSFASYQITEKFAHPYHWWSVEVPDGRTIACEDAGGALQGLCVSPEAHQAIASIRHDIESNSKPGDAVYVFPHMPIFNLMTGRAPFAGAVVSWFDFMSDRQADAVNEKLRANPPPVIIVARLEEIVFKEHERLFRHYKELGQRHILTTIDELEKNKTIKHIDTIKNLDGLYIDVYARVIP